MQTAVLRYSGGTKTCRDFARANEDALGCFGILPFAEPAGIVQLTLFAVLRFEQMSLTLLNGSVFVDVELALLRFELVDCRSQVERL